MSTPHSPFPSENQAKQGSTNQALDGQTSTTGKSAITSSANPKNIEHLTREIVHELISKRIRLLTNWDAVNKLINDRVKNLVNRDSFHEVINKRLENLVDGPAVHKLITNRISPLIERETVHRLLGERLAKTVDRDTVHDIISKHIAEQLKSQRPISWEDDISTNTLDEAPFETLGSPSSRDVELFVQAAAGQGDSETRGTIDIP